MAFKKLLIFMLVLLCFGKAGWGNTDPGPGGATSVSILYGDSRTIWPDFLYGASASIDNGVGSVTSGNPYTVAPLVTTTYTLTVTSPSGDQTTSTITVNVATVVVAPVSPATKNCTEGKNYTFTSSVTGAVDPSIIWYVDGIAGGNSTVGTITSGGIYTAPASAGTHTITAQSNANPAVSQNATVNVYPMPSITAALTATPSSILYYGTSVLTATYQDGTANLSGGASNINPSSSPINWTTPNLDVTTTYTLTVTNPAGDSVTSTATVTVSAVTMTALGVSNSNVSVTATGAVQNTRTITGGVVSGAVDPSVTWLVNGVAGGNATYGTIDPTGHYTAPATLPSNPNITITCMSNAENAITQTIGLTIVPLPVITSFTVN